MKMIIAHLPSGEFDRARLQLNALGVLRISICEVHTASPQSAITLRYRGAPLRSHLRVELKLECVVTDEQSSAVVELMRERAGACGQVTVLDLAEVHQHWVGPDVYANDPRLDTVH